MGVCRGHTPCPFPDFSLQMKFILARRLPNPAMILKLHLSEFDAHIAGNFGVSDF